MEDTLHALERTIDRFRIPHIRDNQFCAVDRGTAAGGMHIGRQQIENLHLVSACEKFAQHVAADEPTPPVSKTRMPAAVSFIAIAYRAATFLCEMSRRTNVLAIFQPA